MDRYDVITLVGVLLLAAGLYFVWWPLALVVSGALLMVVGVVGAARGERVSTKDAKDAR